jgi:ABC-2 type transport system permease protein
MTAVPTTAPVATKLHLSFARITRSEWIKLRTLRSTWWCAALIIVLTVGLGLLIALGLSSHEQITGATAQRVVEVQAATLGITFSQLVAAVLGVLVISGEFGTGMIRSTFAAVPRRTPALLAKMLVLVLALFVIGAIAVALAAVTSAPLLAKGAPLQLGNGGVLMALLGGAVYFALVGLFSFGVGAIIRNTAGGVATAIGVFFVLPIVGTIVAGILQQNWVLNVEAVLPSSAGGNLYSYHGSDVAAPTQSGVLDLNAWQGLLVMLIWVVVANVLAVILVKRRDA